MGGSLQLETPSPLVKLPSPDLTETGAQRAHGPTTRRRTADEGQGESADERAHP